MYSEPEKYGDYWIEAIRPATFKGEAVQWKFFVTTDWRLTNSNIRAYGFAKTEDAALAAARKWIDDNTKNVPLLRQGDTAPAPAAMDPARVLCNRPGGGTHTRLLCVYIPVKSMWRVLRVRAIRSHRCASDL